MSYQNESFGMMDAGYFVPRGDILNWINNLLKVTPSICSSIFPRFSNLVQVRSTAKSWMSSIPAK